LARIADDFGDAEDHFRAEQLFRFTTPLSLHGFENPEAGYYASIYVDYMFTNIFHFQDLSPSELLSNLNALATTWTPTPIYTDCPNHYELFVEHRVQRL
jgi:hypothetical protein